MSWHSITLELDAPQAEILSEALIEAGADSVTLDPLAEGAAGAEGARMRLTALAARDTDPAALVAAAARAAGVTAPAFGLAQLADEDWVRRSQAQFGPIRISANLWIVPSWHAAPDPRATVARLDPGLAFGSGSHPSTCLVLRSLEKSVRRGVRVLDYGCGSGILAVVAGLLGAGEIVATDIDPQALETTAANAARNGVAVRVTSPDRLPPGTFDLVLANILAGPLIALEPQLAERTRPGGRIALSGILEAQAEEVARAYARDFEAAVSMVEEGWALIEGTRR